MSVGSCIAHRLASRISASVVAHFGMFTILRLSLSSCPSGLISVCREGKNCTDTKTRFNRRSNLCYSCWQKSNMRTFVDFRPIESTHPITTKHEYQILCGGDNNNVTTTPVAGSSFMLIKRVPLFLGILHAVRITFTLHALRCSHHLQRCVRSRFGNLESTGGKVGDGDYGY